MAVFARVGRLLRGFLGLFISGIEESNPEALMEAARQEFRDKMAQYNLALARMAGVAERLKGQVTLKSARAQELERRILANHRAGNIELAGSLARELQELKADLTVNSEELKETEDAYQANLRQAKVAQRDFEDKVRRLEKQLSQVKIKEAQAEAATALIERRVQGGGPRRHDEDRRGGAAEALRGVRRQGARGQGHGGHGHRPGERERAEGAGAGGAGRVPRQPGRAGGPDGRGACGRERNWTEGGMTVG